MKETKQDVKTHQNMTSADVMRANTWWDVCERAAYRTRRGKTGLVQVPGRTAGRPFSSPRLSRSRLDCGGNGDSGCPEL